jgi:hypothetical protein
LSSGGGASAFDTNGPRQITQKAASAIENGAAGSIQGLAEWRVVMVRSFAENAMRQRA